MIIPMKKHGFTLIEIMVSLAIFAIVVVVATGALLSTIDATKKAQATQTVLTNLNLALEGMTREIRTGSNYGDVNNATTFSFEDRLGAQITYQLNGGRIERRETASGSFQPITAPEVTIQSLKFTKVNTSLSLPSSQPRVFIVVNGVAGNIQKYKTTFEIQTTVSQRKLNR